MLQLCAEDTAVKLTVIKDKNKSVNVNSDEWEAALSLNDRNQIEKTGQNIKLILLNDPQLKKCVSTALPSRTLPTVQTSAMSETTVLTMNR